MISLQLPEGRQGLTSEDGADTSALAPCNHEEADLRMMIHALDASLHGHRRVNIRSNDTDIVVLAVSIAPTLPLDELWISFCSSKQVRYLPARTIATSLGREKAGVLPMFHALTGCDTVSFFSGRGKKTAWDVFPELTPALKAMLMLLEDIEDTCLDVIERFVILLYNRTTSLSKVNEVRQELFSRKARSLEKSLPLKHPYDNMLKELSSKVVLYGVRPC